MMREITIPKPVIAGDNGTVWGLAEWILDSLSNPKHQILSTVEGCDLVTLIASVLTPVLGKTQEGVKFRVTEEQFAILKNVCQPQSNVSYQIILEVSKMLRGLWSSPLVSE